MQTEYFWTKETDQVFNEWIINQSNAVWFGTIKPTLSMYARYVIRRYSINNINDDGLAANLVSHAAVSLLNTYVKGKGRTIRSYVHLVMQNYLYREYKSSTYQKRDYRKLISIADVDPLETEKWSISSTPYEYLSDPAFLKFFIAYWKLNAGAYFSKKGLKTVLLIIDIVEHPELHLIAESNYLQYLISKLNITRQAINLTIHRMQAHNKDIKEQFDGTGLLHIIFDK